MNDKIISQMLLNQRLILIKATLFNIFKLGNSNIAAMNHCRFESLPPRSGGISLRSTFSHSCILAFSHSCI
jgi:hypothetical protein